MPDGQQDANAWLSNFCIILKSSLIWQEPDPRNHEAGTTVRFIFKVICAFLFGACARSEFFKIFIAAAGWDLAV